MPEKIAIKVYHGFGHMHDLTLFGHVFKKNAKVHTHYTTSPLRNFFRLLRLFFLKPLGGVPVKVNWGNQLIDAKSEYDGFFRAEWTATSETPAGWHDVNVIAASGNIKTAGGEGRIFIPHKTQYAFISDIDDTILISHSATIGKRLKELLFKNPQTRSIFPDVARHYQLLANAHATPDAPNPFFYVSSSEWNLYDYLRDLFSIQQLPNGAFLLSQFKRWYEFAKTGKTKHEGKLMRILRVFTVFPNQRFVLFGDNSQSDPGIYAKLSEKYSDRIFAVYIRNVHPENEQATNQFLKEISSRGIHTFLFTESSEAIKHSKKIGLIQI